MGGSRGKTEPGGDVTGIGTDPALDVSIRYSVGREFQTIMREPIPFVALGLPPFTGVAVSHEHHDVDAFQLKPVTNWTDGAIRGRFPVCAAPTDFLGTTAPSGQAPRRERHLEA